jgi:hypothetical protein
MTVTKAGFVPDWKRAFRGAESSDGGTYAKGLGPYDGEWSGTCRHGRGTQLWDRGLLVGNVYEGAWADGKPNGIGKLLVMDGSVLDGNVRSSFANFQCACI